MPKTPSINYKLLRKVNPEAARTAVLGYLSSTKGNISQAARMFGIQRTTVYQIIKKQKSGNLKDYSKTPQTIANKTSTEVVEKILKVRKKTGFGAKKLVKYLAKKHQLTIPLGTIKGILRRTS